MKRAVEAPEAPLAVLYMVGKFMLGGTERHVLRVLQRVDRRHVHPHAAALSAGGIWFDRVADLGVPFFEIGLEARPVDPRYLPRILGLRRFAREHGIRIVHAYGWEMQMLACWLKILCPDLVLVGTRRTVAALERDLHLLAYRATHRLFDRIVAVSESARASAIEAEGLSPDRICTIPNGIEVDGLPQRRASTSGLLRIGTVANVKRRKGYFWAVEGLAELERRGVPFEYHVIGRPDTGDDLERRARELGIADRLRFHGEVAEPASLVADLDVFLMPTYQEGMSNAVLEAMAMGLPVVATRVTGNVDVIQDGVDGRLIEPEDRAGLAAVLEWIANDRASAEALGQAARQRVLREFTLDRMLDRMARLYGELVA